MTRNKLVIFEVKSTLQDSRGELSFFVQTILDTPLDTNVVLELKQNMKYHSLKDNPYKRGISQNDRSNIVYIGKEQSISIIAAVIDKDTPIDAEALFKATKKALEGETLSRNSRDVITMEVTESNAEITFLPQNARMFKDKSFRAFVSPMNKVSTLNYIKFRGGQITKVYKVLFSFQVYYTIGQTDYGKFYHKNIVYLSDNSEDRKEELKVFKEEGSQITHTMISSTKFKARTEIAEI